MVRLGLCCTFLEEPIKFRTTTARYVSSLRPRDRRAFLRELVRHNVQALAAAVTWCSDHGVGAFRVCSSILPLFTHPELGWELDEDLADAFFQVGELAWLLDIRLSFHPDQFVVPGSTTPSVVDASLEELEYMAMVAGLIGAEQLTIHGGGAQGGKEASLERLRLGLDRLSPIARSKVALENDDRVYTVEDLLPLCEKMRLPLVYDVHHHRCNPDRLSIEEATELAASTWNGREPWVHLSSPAQGWRSRDPRPHADYIRPGDLPQTWLERTHTIDVEAKAKELAVLRLQRGLGRTNARRDRAQQAA